ncbi:MAG: ABC transporter substrate-binding protein, partial [Chloroflexota bacterium]
KNRYVTLLLSLALAFYLGAIPGSAWGKDIKLLKIGIGVDPDTLLPLELTTAIPYNIAKLIYGALAKYTDDGEMVPNLATAWSFSPDGKKFTVHLRKGVKFTDGSDFNAQSHKNYMDLIENPKVRVPLRFLFGPVESVDVIDSHTVQYNLKAPFAPMEQVLAISSAMSFKATTPFNVDKLRKEHVGAGPYKLTEWVKGERIVLERNENFWGERPTVDKIIYMIIPESATRVAMLRAGQLDIAYSPSPPDIKALEADPDFSVLRPLSTRMIFMGMNTQKGYTKNKLFRQALNYAVDKKAICDRILFGICAPLDSPVPPSLFGYSKLPNQYDYNPEKAKALLKESGFPMDAELKMVTPNGRYTYDKQIAETVQAYLQNIGLKVSLRTYDWPTYVGMLLKPIETTELELYLIGWGAPYYDADFMTFMYFSSYVQPPKGLGATFYSSKEFDMTTYKARSIINKEERKALYQKATQMLWDDAPAIWLHVEPFSVAYSSKYQGIRVLPHEMCFPQYMTYK